MLGNNSLVAQCLQMQQVNKYAVVKLEQGIYRAIL